MRYLDVLFNFQVGGINYGMSFVVHSWHFEYLRVLNGDDRLLGE
jgi:hypothetical protein